MSMSPSSSTSSARGTNAGAGMADKASDIASAASVQIDKMVQSAEGTVRSVAAQGRDAGERVQEVAGNFQAAVDKSVREQPLATLAVAAALGFVLGALWKS